MANITLLQSYIPFKDIYMSFNYPDWSISTEMFFYVCFPFIVNALSKSKRKIRALLVVTLILLVTILVAIPQTSKALQHAIYYINPFVRVTDFCIGILVYLIYNKYRNISWPDYIFTLLETLSLMVFGVFFIYHSSVNITYRYSVYYWLPMILIIFIFAYQKGYFSRLLSHPTLLLLGEASFGFYLIHQIAIRYFVFFNKRYFHIENEILMIVITFSAALLFSILSYKFVEPKLNIWVKNKLEYKK